MDQGWSAHQGWIPYQTGQSVCNCPISQSIYNEYNSLAGQSVYNEVITRPACQSIIAIIFNKRPASWSTMDLLMDWPLYLQWVWKQLASRFKIGHRPDQVAHVRWGIIKQGGQSKMGLIHWSVCIMGLLKQAWWHVPQTWCRRSAFSCSRFEKHIWFSPGPSWFSSCKPWLHVWCGIPYVSLY